MCVKKIEISAIHLELRESKPKRRRKSKDIEINPQENSHPGTNQA